MKYMKTALHIERKFKNIFQQREKGQESTEMNFFWGGGKAHCETEQG